jgi:hypothetical protein
MAHTPPVTRVGLPPLPNAVHVLWIAEVIPILRLLQPAPLAGAFTGTAALRLGAVALALDISEIGDKGLTTM